MKKGLLLLVACAFACASSARDIELKSGGTPEPGEPTDPRSIENVITASFDDLVVTVLYGEMTASQIVVSNSVNTTVYDQTYASAYSVQANLSALTSGSYTLYVFALGSWWYGYFEIE